MSQVVRFSILLLILCAVSTPARAQESGARIAGFYAGTFGEGETNVAAGGSVGYRFTPRIGFELEALALPDLEFGNSGGDGRGVAFLTNFVTEFPSPARWLTPYVQGGGGVANVSQSGFILAAEADPRFDPRRDPRLPMMGRVDGRGNPAITMPAGEFGRRRSETGVALSVGGGVDFTVWRGLAIGPSISYLKLFGTVTDRDLTRVGFRTSYRV